MKQLKFGIAGHGKMGRIRKESILASEQAHLVSIYDIVKHKTDDEDVIFCNSYEELLDTDIDAVIVSVFVSVASQ